MILDSPGPMLPTSESHSVFRTTNDPGERLKTRHELLASLPLPESVPADELKPLVLPGTMTIKEFILSSCNVRLPSACDAETNPSTSSFSFFEMGITLCHDFIDGSDPHVADCRTIASSKSSPPPGVLTVKNTGSC